ncbi:GH36-type glycosyl hydrolase domain-containing protein [Fibrobacterota bacterium]
MVKPDTKPWHFDKSTNEFIIHTPHTPRPWINYLNNGRYFALVSQTGGGFSFYKDPSHHALLRREQDMLLNDRPGRFIFLQDLSDRSYWNIGANPAVTVPGEFKCVHGFGHTTVESVHRDIAAGVTYFVPENHDAEIWCIRIENRSGEQKQLRVFAFLEWLLGNSVVDPVARTFDCFFKHTRVAGDIILAEKLKWGLRGQRENSPWELCAFSAATRPADRTWLDKHEFIGPYRDLSRPSAVENPELEPQHPQELWGADMTGTREWRLSLEPGETQSWEMITGVSAPERALETAQSLCNSNFIHTSLEETRASWRRRVSAVNISTPSEELNQLHNGWVPYQIMVKSSISSAPSYYHASDGSPGFRDAMQDAFGLCALEPDEARDLILRLIAFQYSDGAASHRAPRVALPPERSEKSDLPLWIPLTVLQYIKETGDTGIINEEVPYADQGKATVLGHVQAGLERSWKDKGAHGLPLIHYGDWNDALDGLGGQGKGESVFLGQFLAYALKNAAVLAMLAGKQDLTRTWVGKHDELVAVLNRDCWEQDRFVRAFHDDGTVIGSRECREGRLYLNPQVWAVIGGLAPAERQKACMETLEKELDTPYGIRCLAPPYSKYDPRVGLISCFPPGIKENGAVFSHAMSFCLVAELMLGRAEQAWELIFQKANPVVRASSGTDYKVEPYVYSQFVAGPETNLDGQGFHHWLTSTCSWMQYAVINWMLGARALLDGLLIDPCIPSHWQRYEFTRPYRGCEVQVIVENPRGKNKGIKTLTADGKAVEGNIIRVEGRKRIEVRAVLG